MAMVVLYEKVYQAWFEAFAAFLREHQAEGLPLHLAECDDTEPEKTQALLKEAHVLVVGLAGQRGALGRAAIEGAPELRLVQKVGSRLAGVDVPAARDARVQVSLLPAPAHVACAEHTILLILALARKLLAAHERVAKRPFKEAGPPPRPAGMGDYAYNWANLDGIGLVAGKTLGLVGMGDIGVEVARRAKALGLKLIYCDKEPLPEGEERELGLARRELDDLLKEADFVSLHVGLNAETEKFINAERLGMMKPTAFLVNTARGGIVDEAALADALRGGRLAGAALDAWAVEPTPRDNPLLKLDNVVATPHVAAGTLSKTALFEAILPNILGALRGEAVAGSLTPGVEPKPALPIEAPAPQEAPKEGEVTPPEAAAAPEAPVAEGTPPAEEPVVLQERAAAKEAFQNEDTPPTLELKPGD